MKPTKHTPFRTEYKCGKCSKHLYPTWTYCSYCGELIDWDDQIDKHPYEDSND